MNKRIPIQHLKDQTNSYLSGLSETEKGSCCDFAPVIFLNFDIDKEIFVEAMMKSFIAPLKDQTDQYRVYRHELFHCYSLVGSSLGYLYHFLYHIKTAIAGEVLDQLKDFEKPGKLKPNFLESGNYERYFNDTHY